MREWSRSASLLISGHTRSFLSAWLLLQAVRVHFLASVLTKPQFPSGQVWQLHLNTRTFLLSLFHNNLTKGARSQGCLIVSGKTGGKERDESILSLYYLLFFRKLFHLYLKPTQMLRLNMNAVGCSFHVGEATVEESNKYLLWNRGQRPDCTNTWMQRHERKGVQQTDPAPLSHKLCKRGTFK